MIVLSTLVTLPASAQTLPPVDDEAELVFDQALQAYQAEDYGMAYRRFRLAMTGYPEHRKSSAAALMAGKSLYAMGEYADAVDLLKRFVRDFPTSGYLGEARRVIDFAREQEALAARNADPIELGIVLPLSGRDLAASQALFTGIRMVVDAANDAGGRPVRMVFRDTERDPELAAAHVEDLARGGADAIVGPLYSDEALAAAEAAERMGVVLIAPLATDEGVSDDRRFVFQANPTISMRGRLMARYAVRSLRLDTLAVVAQYDASSIGERMAEGFQDEAIRLGAETVFYDVLPSENEWYRLDARVAADTLRRVQALFMPVVGSEPTRLIGAALTSLDRIFSRGGPGALRVLGNSTWHDLPFADRASSYGTSYLNDFYVDDADPAVDAFRSRYRALAGDAPGRLGFVGYDVARMVLGEIQQAGGQPLYQALRDAPRYEGLGVPIDFDGGNVNQAVRLFRYRDGEIERMR